MNRFDGIHIYLIALGAVSIALTATPVGIAIGMGVFGLGVWLCSIDYSRSGI